MTTSPDLGIPYIANQQAQPEVTHNDALNMLIALQKGAIDKDLNAPPGSPTNGDVYIVGAAPTGAWAGKANKIAIYATNAWVFVPGNDSNGSNIAISARHEGLKIWVQDEDLLYSWSGSAWQKISAPLPLSIANGGTGQTTAVAAIDALSVKGADIASAATTNLATATGDFVDVTGTTTITALGTASAGVERAVRFTGALTLTHNATSLILPGAVNIATAAGDVARFRSLGSGNWVCVGYARADGGGISAALPIARGGSGQVTAVAAIDAFSVKGADIASAATTNLAAATGDFVDVTGTSTISALGTAAAGVERVVRFTGALTIVHNATSLIMPGGDNIFTAAGDVARFRSLGSGNWLCVGYIRNNGLAPGQAEHSADYTLALSDTGKQLYHDSGSTHTWTIPANASVAFLNGTQMVLINRNGSGNLTIAITSDTLRWAGSASTGSRTLAPNGVARLYKSNTNEWYIDGVGLT